MQSWMQLFSFLFHHIKMATGGASYFLHVQSSFERAW